MPGLIPLGRYKVEYVNGETVEVLSNFGAIMELERLLPGDDSPNATTLVTGIWLFLGKPDDDPEKWACNVHQITPMEPEARDPSGPEAGGS